MKVYKLNIRHEIKNTSYEFWPKIWHPVSRKATLGILTYLLTNLLTRWSVHIMLCIQFEAYPRVPGLFMWGVILSGLLHFHVLTKLGSHYMHFMSYSWCNFKTNFPLKWNWDVFNSSFPTQPPSIILIFNKFFKLIFSSMFENKNFASSQNV